MARSAGAERQCGLVAVLAGEFVARFGAVSGCVVALMAGGGIAARSASAAQVETAEPAEPPLLLRVRVVDGADQPVHDVPVALLIDRSLLVGCEVDRATARRTDHLNQRLLVARSDAVDGIATFDVAPLQFALEEYEHLGTVARLLLPTLDPVQARVDLRAPADEPLCLVCPEVGRIRLELTGVVRGHARLRALDDDEPLDRRRFASDAKDAELIASGVACFPRVPLDREFAYEVRFDEAQPPLTGRLHGPRRAGEEVVFTPPGLVAGSVACGRLLDEAGRPLAERQVDVLIDAAPGGTGEAHGTVVLTDRAGRFALPLAAAAGKGARRGLRFLLELPAGDRALPVTLEGELELAKALPAGPQPVGDVILIEPGSPRWLARLGDDELLATWQVRRAAAETAPVALDACLLEMARRKSERWRKFLAAELKQARAAGDGGDRRPRELALLTALRRAQGKGDPLALELVDAPPFTAGYPESPTVRFRLRNVDGGKESFTLTRAGDYRSGRFARIGVVATDVDGVPVPVRIRFGLRDGGAADRAPLASGVAWTEEVRLQDFVEFPAPGDYEVRLAYHDEVAIAEVERLDGFVVAWSPAFKVRLVPAAVEVTRATVDALKREFAAIDLRQPVPLLAHPWRADLELVGEPATPEDRLFRAGWDAVPTLLELLEDAKLTVEQRSWVLGLLWDLTGMHCPLLDERRRAVHEFRWLPTWPTVDAAAPADWREPDAVGAPFRAEDQQELCARWKACRSWFVLRITNGHSR